MISVAIATYNGSKFIEKQLESIKNQVMPCDEVIICDDRSTDGTADLCRNFIEKNNLSEWKVFENEKNEGFCLNFYSAVKKCRGDYIFIADQDDEWLPRKTEQMVKVMEENPDIAVLSSRYDIIDENSNPVNNIPVSYMGESFDGSIEYYGTKDFIGCSFVRGFSLCISKSVKEYIKPIDLKDLLAHDWLFCMIGCNIGKTAVLNTVLTHYRYHGDNVSLSAMDKKTRIRSRSKRINGLKQSVLGHQFVLSLVKDKKTAEDIRKFTDFEKKRIKFLESRNIFVFLSLLFCLKQYGRYYKGKNIRVYLGDFVYIFKK